MTHWSTEYIGKPYALGIADCAQLIYEIRRDVFNAPVPDLDDVNRAASRLKRAGQLSDLVDMYGQRTDSPVEGDAVLMLCAGRPSHIGVYCIVNDEPCVLHAMENARMTVLHKIRELERVLIRVEGYYSWK